MDFAWGIVANIPEENIISISIETEGEITVKFFLNVLAILFGLFSTEFRVFRSLFGFYYSERFSVFSKENIICVFISF